jgi:gluconolactonase
MKPDNTIEVIADNFKGKKLNSPNDVAVKSNGAVYFTDPPYAAKGKNRNRELSFCGIYRVFNGNIELIDSTFTYPNGVAFSPDEKYLYAGCSDNKNKVWKRYTLDKEGNITNQEMFYNATSIPANGAPDGFKTDKKGNMYATGPGGVLIFSPKAKLLGIIKIAEGATNVAFGDNDGKTLYITARASVYKIRTLIGGW